MLEEREIELCGGRNVGGEIEGVEIDKAANENEVAAIEVFLGLGLIEVGLGEMEGGD